jgi:hypothetical protein
MSQNFLSAFPRYYATQPFDSRAMYIRDAAKFPQQPLRRQPPNPWNIPKRRLSLPFAATQAVKRHRKAVRLITNLLNQMQHRRMMIQHARLIFLPVDIQDLFAFRDARQGLVNYL